LRLENANGQLAQQLGAVDAEGHVVTTLEDVRRLPDGRVGVLRLGSSPDNSEFTIFVEKDGRWLVDETRQVASTLDLQG
jgi:hypothetical protein